MFLSSESHLIWFLFYKLTHFIFFISVNRKMTWDRWRILNFCKFLLRIASLYVRIHIHVLHRLVHNCLISFVVNICTWSRLHLLFSKPPIIKPLLLWYEVWWLFDNLYAHTIKSLSLKLFSLVHCFIYLRKTNWWIILARSWIVCLLLSTHLFILSVHKNFFILMENFFSPRIKFINKVFAISIYDYFKGFLAVEKV